MVVPRESWEYLEALPWNIESVGNSGPGQFLGRIPCRIAEVVMKQKAQMWTTKSEWSEGSNLVPLSAYCVEVQFSLVHLLGRGEG